MRTGIPDETVPQTDITLSMNWFEDTFGFVEGKSYQANQEQFSLHNDENGVILVSKPNSKRFRVGHFEVLSVADLKERVNSLAKESVDFEGRTSGLKFSNVIGSVKTYIQNRPGAVFQVASQFNCLEMVGPGVTPNHGITQYVLDKTQGPACALACPGGTLFRNYFVNGSGQGTGGAQINTLSSVEKLLASGIPSDDRTSATKRPGTSCCPYWTMKNGYSLPQTPESMAALNLRLNDDPGLLNSLRENVQVGIHWNVEVASRKKQKSAAAVSTSAESPPTVCQIFASACPVAYTKSTKSKDWAPFASMVLEGAYEATLAAAIVLSYSRKERVEVYLTSLGGGAFGNRRCWINRALERALDLFRDAPLDVFLVSYSAVPADLKRLAAKKAKHQDSEERE